MRATLLPAVAALSVLAAASHAHAFCRTTTCDPSDPSQGCRKNTEQCLTTGAPLFWESSCLTIGVHEGGSARHGIGFEQLKEATTAAFRVWTEASCAPGAPALAVEVVGPIPCDRAEYNQGAGNVNLVVFRDDVWPYPGAIDILGRTTVRFNPETGALRDADIEINGTLGAVTLDGSGEIDLSSVLTHEAGHVLGLDHSIFVGATMRAGYTTDDTSLRSLTSDDESGICALFPPGAAASCESGRFSDRCGGSIEPAPAAPPAADGCAVALAPVRGIALAIAVGSGMLLLVARRRARRRWEST
jgi:hypothetical protein